MVAGLFAALAILAISTIARQTGFSLSGSEFLMAIVCGWLLGIVVELGYKKLKG